MGDHDDGGATGVEFLEQAEYLLAVGTVEVARRLIGEDHVGARHDGARYGHALLLAAGQLMGEVLGAVGDVHAAHGLGDALLALSRRDAHVEQRQGDVLLYVQLVDEVETLEHEAQTTLADLGALVFGETADFDAVDLVGAGGGVVEQAEDVEQRGLAAA